MALGRPCSAPFYSSRALAGLCLPYRGRATSPRFTSSRTTWARPHVETSRPEASANAPPSTPRPRQIELGAASSLGPPAAAAGLGHKAGMFRLARHTGLVPRVGALRFYERYGFVVDPDGFCKDHYLIEGVLHDAYRLTYSLPPPQSLSLLSFLPRCTVV